MKEPAATSDSPLQMVWWSSQAMVYFIGADSPPVAIKIGVTKWSRAKNRIGECQTGNHEPLELLGVIPFLDGDLPLRQAEVLERKLHEDFRAFQRFPEGSRGHEWFHARPELLAHIQANTQSPEKFGFARNVSKMTGPKRPSVRSAKSVVK